MSHVEVGAAAVERRHEDILQNTSELPGAARDTGTVVDGMRPGVVEIESNAARQRTANRQDHSVIVGVARVRPGRIGASLRSKEGVAAGHRDAVRERGGSYPVQLVKIVE